MYILKAGCASVGTTYTALTDTTGLAAAWLRTNYNIMLYAPRWIPSWGIFVCPTRLHYGDVNMLYSSPVLLEVPPIGQGMLIDRLYTFFTEWQTLADRGRCCCGHSRGRRRHTLSTGLDGYTYHRGNSHGNQYSDRQRNSRPHRHPATDNRQVYPDATTHGSYTYGSTPFSNTYAVAPYPKDNLVAYAA